MARQAGKQMNQLRSFVSVTTGAGLVFAGFCIYKGNEKFYDELLMPAIRLLPPETSHNLAVVACKYKMFGPPDTPDPLNLSTKFFGRTISNPIGIAAGFDKQGEAIEGLDRVGFGFVEIGSVTPEPQPGNPQPRVFRLTADQAIINRYGFNSEGHVAVRERLGQLKQNNQFKGIIGVNLGKNKTTAFALKDYVQGVKVFGPVADYLVVNISSPNTPGLRNLQGRQSLQRLLMAVIDARSQLPVRVPILLKLSPDMTQSELEDVADVINSPDCRVDGLILSNTTVSRDLNLKQKALALDTIGGLSGKPLRSKSTQMIAQMYKLTNGRIPIIGVGGISSGRDAFEKLEAGASYLQCYTAFIFHGPPVVTRIKRELSEILAQHGYQNVEEAVGKNYKKYLK